MAFGNLKISQDLRVYVPHKSQRRRQLFLLMPPSLKIMNVLLGQETLLMSVSPTLP